MVMSNKQLRIVYAGDRDIAVKVLRFIMEDGIKPVALLVSTTDRATHANELIDLCGHLDAKLIFYGNELNNANCMSLLSNLQPDLIIAVHFPYIFKRELLEIPKRGVVNLHPAYLPYNRGWHTPSWVILDDTPFGATLHFMVEEVDIGDIIHQKPLPVLPNDTANSLYQRVKDLEFEVFCEAWPSIVAGDYRKIPQNRMAGTTHGKKDLFSPHVQLIDLDERVKAGDLITRLRALTTNNVNEAAYYVIGGIRYRIQVCITADDNVRAN